MTDNIQQIVKPPEELVSYLRANKCVLFVGSGLSKCAGLPTWEELLQIILDKLRNGQLSTIHPDELVELENLFDTKKFLEIAEYLRVKLGRKLYSNILYPLLRGDKVKLPDHHSIIMRLPFAGIVTTNYDKLLERAYTKERGGDVLPKTASHNEYEKVGPLLIDDETFILKAHGDIETESSLVFTTSDYSQIIHNNQAFNAIFSAILLTKAILFIGYSITDPDFRLLLDRQITIFKGRLPGRYALMKKSKVGKVERDILEQTAGIEVIWYNEHDDVLGFLRELEKELYRGPRLPSLFDI